jgi:hypothetical protein
MSNCNKCNKITACSCSDYGLTTPCSYSDCESGSEKCESIQPVECTGYYGNTFQVETINGILKISNGDRLDVILQKFALLFANGLGVCTADNLHHAPYGLKGEALSSTSMIINWTGVSALSESFNLFYKINDPLALFIQANTLPISNTSSSYTLINLTPGTTYVVYLESIDIALDTCNSVEILVTVPMLQ